MTSKCKYGGGHSCVRQGGDGFVVHPEGFLHKAVTSLEMIPVLDEVEVSDESFFVKSLEPYIPDDEVGATLSKGFEEESLIKALYNFDIETEDGITRLMELLPVLSDDIIKDVYVEVWPNYPTDDDEKFNIRMARLELKGYFLDYLNINEE